MIKNLVGAALLISACSLPVVPYSALCKRGVVLLFEAGWDRQRLNDLTKVAESLSRAHILSSKAARGWTQLPLSVACFPRGSRDFIANSGLRG